jgi:exopolysaccharide biosynthesis polyprenyl glycosylphosphotransferase
MLTSSQQSVSLRSDLRSPVATRFRQGSTISSLRVVVLICLDALLVYAAWHLANTWGTPITSAWSGKSPSLYLLLVVAIEIGIIAARGLYKQGDRRRDYIGLIKSISLAEVLLLLVAFLYEPNRFVSRSTFLIFWVLTTAFVCTGRVLIDLATDRLRKQGMVRYPIFLIADTQDRQDSTELIEQENRYDIIGIEGADCLDRDKRDTTLTKLRQLGIAEVFVSWEAVKNRLYVCWHFQSAGITLRILPLSSKPLSPKFELWSVGGLPSLTVPAPLITGIDFQAKRCFDFICSSILLLLFLPVYLGVALLIKLDSPGPIFFRQTRVGLHGREFKAWKFRTMIADADRLQKALEAKNETTDGVLFKMKEDPRITRVGKFLRRYSIDELPQLFNVLLGEMSLVGPRPLPIRDVEKFSSAYHFIRHEVLPGITGLWQVSGRSDVTDFDQVVRLDVQYIENWSLLLDIKILIDTVKVVVLKKGAY